MLFIFVKKVTWFGKKLRLDKKLLGLQFNLALILNFDQNV